MLGYTELVDMIGIYIETAPDAFTPLATEFYKQAIKMSPTSKL